MRTDYSQPSRALQPRRSASSWRQDEQEEEKQVDYSHLSIVAEVTRITNCSLKHETKDEYSGRCPFPHCTSRKDGFRVWERTTLGLTRDGKREKHFWCRRCDRSGDLIGLLRQYQEATV